MLQILNALPKLLTLYHRCSAFEGQKNLKGMFARAHSQPNILPPAVLKTCLELEQVLLATV
jgi:hypothetical protein